MTEIARSKVHGPAIGLKVTAGARKIIEAAGGKVLE